MNLFLDCGIDSKNIPQATKGHIGYNRKRTSHLQQWLAQFRVYPDSARQQGWEGIVELSFLIEPSGRVHGARIAQSSGYAILDNAAFEMLDQAAPLPPIPQAVSSKAMRITVPVGFHLQR